MYLANLENKYKYLFYIWLGIYFVFLLINLDRIPVAWTDETQLLDPASRFIYNGIFNTTTYPFETGSEIFAASLPFIQWIYILILKFIGNDIFFIRLPMAIAAFLSGLWLLKLLKIESNNWLIYSIVPFLFLNDINVYEMIRAGRVEIFSALLFIGAFYNYKTANNRIIKYYLSTFLISLLILTHPVAWPAGLVLFSFNIYMVKGYLNKIALAVLVVLPCLFWFWFIDFNFIALQDQLLGQGKLHEASRSPGNSFTNFLWYRFWPFWKSQPYMIVFHILVLIASLRNIYKVRKPKLLILEFCFWATEIFMALMLATHHRYNVLLVLIILLLMAKYSIAYLPKINLKRMQWIFLLAMPIIIFPFISRNTIGLAERSERDSKSVLNWLEQHIPYEEKTLLTGSDILHYYAMDKDNCLFFELIYPQEINFEQFNHFYALLKSPPHNKATPIAVYTIKKSYWSKILSDFSNSQNYNGLTLYRIPNNEIIKQITEPFNDKN